MNSHQSHSPAGKQASPTSNTPVWEQASPVVKPAAAAGKQASPVRRPAYGKILLWLLLSAFVWTGCNTYEEGPWISFTKKENRIRGFWELGAVYKNGVKTTDEHPSSVESRESVWELYKNKTLLITFLEGETYYKSNGSWKFEEDKENLGVTFTTRYASLTRSYTILKLSNKEMKLKFKDEEGDTWVLVFSIIQSFAGYDY